MIKILVIQKKSNKLMKRQKNQNGFFFRDKYEELNNQYDESFKTNCIRGYDENFGNPKKIEQTDETSKKLE
jgi:hypothetical protein